MRVPLAKASNQNGAVLFLKKNKTYIVSPVRGTKTKVAFKIPRAAPTKPAMLPPTSPEIIATIIPPTKSNEEPP
jgi:hypothetical protein